jgi:protoheme IX farnesyltransferase
MSIQDTALSGAGRIAWRRYFSLTKPKVVALILFTALVGMLLATPGMVPWRTLLFGLLGIGLAAASGAAFNHVADRRIDAAMQRTHHRPLPSGELSAGPALLFASLLGGLSMLVLTLLVNGLTALLSFAALIGYALIYTLYLKRQTPHNIVWGGLAGAAPPVLGWSAVSGEIHLHALLPALLIFIWTPPHFWALAVRRREEYARAGLPMLPVTHGVAFTKWQVLLYSMLLSWVSLLPYLAQMSGLTYLIGALALDLGFYYYAVQLWRSKDARYAMRTFHYSILYLTAIFGLLLVDHYLK